MLQETRSTPTPGDIKEGRNGRLGALCRCDCGTEKVVTLKSLHAKRTPSTSCGCYHSELTSTLVKQRSTTHGLSGTPEYEQVLNRIDRCYNTKNPRFKDYGGRGVQVWQPWRDNPSTFVKWLLDNLGARPKNHTLDRINNNGNYAPGNLRWATYATQGQNSRHTKLTENDIHNIREKYASGNFTQTELAIEFHVNQTNISQIVRNKTRANTNTDDMPPNEWLWL